jgi:hypothetical protein
MGARPDRKSYAGVASATAPTSRTAGAVLTAKRIRQHMKLHFDPLARGHGQRMHIGLLPERPSRLPTTTETDCPSKLIHGQPASKTQSAMMA